MKPAILAVDSIQTQYLPELSSAPGTVTQIREVAARLMGYAKTTETPVFLVGHVTKDGSIAGPRVLEHIVDTVLYFEGDGRSSLRVLRAAPAGVNGDGDDVAAAFAGVGAGGTTFLPVPSALRKEDDTRVMGDGVLPAGERGGGVGSGAWREAAACGGVKGRWRSATMGSNTPPESTPAPSGRDMAANAMAMVRNLEAQVARNTDDYNKRPRKMFVGVRATEYRFAQYVDDWRQKVERFGNLNYPDTARGKVYGSLRMSVSINPDGSLAAVEIERSSGHKLLDAAAERIVRMAAPYARFPDNIRRDVDVLVITRTWNFEQGDRIMTE
jgi:TonB family protein